MTDSAAETVMESDVVKPPQSVPVVAEPPAVVEDEGGEAEDDNEEEEEEEEEGSDEEEAVDEDGEPDYIWLSPAEFNDPNLPYLLGAPANPNSTRTHSRRQKSADSLFPHLSDTLYRCKEYPHGVFINSYGQLCPDDKRSGLYQIDERAAEKDQADDELAQAEDAVEAEEEEDDEEDDVEDEDKDNDDAPPDARDVTWVKAENAIRAKKGLKRKKVVPDDDEDDYKPESGDDEDEDDDDKASEGEADEVDTDEEFQDEELAGTDEDHEWDPQADRKEHEHGGPSRKKAKGSEEGSDDDEDSDDDDDDKDSHGQPLPKEADEYEVDEPGTKTAATKEPKPELTPEQRKEAYLKAMQSAEERQAQLNKVTEQRQRQRIQDQKNLRLLENWSEEWKKIRSKIFREEKAAESDPEKRKKIKNTSINMTFEAHILSKDDPGCDFVFRKPVVRPKKGESGPKPVSLPALTASFDCQTSEVICGQCAGRFSHMPTLYRHLAEHFVEARMLAALQQATASAATAPAPVALGLPANLLPVTIAQQSASIITNVF